MKRLIGLLLGTFVSLGSANAVEPLVEGETFRLDLAGFVSQLAGAQYIPYDNPLLEESVTGLNASIMRLEWRGQITEHVAFVVHNRLFWTLSSQSSGAGAVGLGATIPPERTLDLSTSIIEQERLTLEHDLDRLAFNIFTPFADITVGRQAITWGVASIFSVSDLWTQFSPFELDTSQKRGVDALRGLMYPGEGFELDVLVVDRGTLEDLSGGARLSWSGEMGDYSASFAKSYMRLWSMMTVAVDLDYFRPYFEMALPIDLDEGELELPRASVGTDYIRSDYTFTLEYHFNGYGTDDSEDYLSELTSPEVGRGEQYFAGRHLAGAAVSYLPREDISLILAVIGNVVDPSAILTPTVNYEVVQDVNLKLGAYIGVGEYPTIAFTGFEVPSEFGTYGQFYFTELSAFF